MFFFFPRFFGAFSFFTFFFLNVYRLTDNSTFTGKVTYNLYLLISLHAKHWTKHSCIESEKVQVFVIQSCLTLCDPMDCRLPGSPVHGMNAPGKSSGVGSHSLLQEIFLTRDWTWISCIAGKLFTVWASRKRNKVCCDQYF